MAAVDPYSPCPCGSGQKFKWCCHKVEAYAERAQRQFDNGQYEAALQALDEGLRKEPGNPWLLTRKALYLVRLGRPEPAKEALLPVFRKQPKHLGAHLLMTRLVLETEGSNAGAGQFQQALTAFPANERKDLAPLARVVGAFLSEEGYFPAALMHLRLAQQLNPEIEPLIASGLRAIETNPGVTPWMKNPYRLSPPPEGLAGPGREQFDQAARWAQEGLWSSAASAFDLLSADPSAGPEADRNLGLCRLWLADNAGAVQALRRAVGRMGATEEAVDLEALCQEVAPPGPDDQIERVQLIWPLRDRDALLAALRADPAVFEDAPGPIDPDDPESPEVEQFSLLDRPVTPNRPDLRPEDLSRFVGRVLVGREIVALETYDDGRLDGLVERVTTLAGPAVPPAHPRTKVLETTTRTALILSWDWVIPEGMDRETLRRLNREEGARLIGERWPNTPMSYLWGRTPLQAGQAGDAVVPLRAAVFQLEQTREDWREGFDFGALRARLNIPPEPPVAPETVDLAAIHLARLSLVPVERLNDERLAALYRRARAHGLVDVIDRAARELVNRPGSWEAVRIDPMTLHADLATTAAAGGRMDEALNWIRRGRQADPASARARNAPHWDLLEIRLRARTEAPETWVPELAVVLERYAEDDDANRLIMMTLLEMGLIDVQPNPDRPDDFLVDTRVLQAVLAEYGPRVTTATGRLGVSATKGGIWTPGSEAGGAGGLWTPGAGTSASPSAPGEKPKLIIPGR